MLRWRWDQGRLDYFRYDALRRASAALVKLDGVAFAGPDPLRGPLTAATRLSYPPADYRVWRNFGRIYKAALLATNISGRLRVTELCRDIATGNKIPTADEYLTFLVPRLFMPSPAFSDYSADAPRVYPLCALIRYLLAHASKTGASISLDDIFRKVIGNGCVGNEPLDFYKTLPESGYAPVGDEERQVRELVTFASQFSPLKWERPTLFLDVTSDAEHLLEQLLQVATPLEDERDENADAEVLRLGNSTGIVIDALVIEEHAFPEDEVFTEGKRIRAYHLRIERSRKLRQLFFARANKPYRCDLCGMVPSHKYPWTSNILELHHLLPLSAPIRVDEAGTHLDDMIALCPTCHRAVHAFYASWLKGKGLDDFPTKKTAKDAYDEAKTEIAA